MGLDYGNRFRIVSDWAYSEGVFYADKIDKYIVRIREGKSIKTMSAHEKESDAIIQYDKLKKQ